LENVFKFKTIIQVTSESFFGSNTVSSVSCLLDKLTFEIKQN